MAAFVKIENGWPTINVGAMRHAIAIKQLGPGSPVTYDVAGPVTSWTAFTTAMAAIEIIRGTDVIKSGQTTTELYLTVGIWFQPGILSNMRVESDNGSTYLIQSIENVSELNVVLLLNCIALGSNQ